MNKRTNRLLILNVIVMAALLAVVAGPPAYSAGKRLITGADVQDNSLTGTDVQDGSLTGADVQDSALAGADVGDASLTGADVQDGTLSAADVDASVTRKPMTTYTQSTSVVLPPGENGSTVAQCRDENDQVLTGSYSAHEAFEASFVGAEDDPPHSFIYDYFGVIGTNGGTNSVTLVVSAICQQVD